jgi:hypothetical protein
MRKCHPILAAVALAVVVVATIFLIDGAQDAGTQVIPPKEEQKATSDTRGPRPTVTRLRNGAQQVESASEALAAAEKSLARVEAETASTTDPEKRKTLERQKALIKAAIARLKK